MHRVAGLGSLGRRRFVALATWHDGSIAREAKELTDSAWRWLSGEDAQSPKFAIRKPSIKPGAVRIPLCG